MRPRIALVLLMGDRRGAVEPLDVEWPLGPVIGCEAHAAAICRAVGEVVDQADYVLLWDPALGSPSAARAEDAATLPGDAWHAGLRLGQRGRPALMDAVHPGWMLLQDPDPGIVASSWRLTLRACLVRSTVWRQLGGPAKDFDSLDGAALELGLRWLWAGALMRHVPDLLGDAVATIDPEALPAIDQLRIIQRQSGRFWSTWAMLRGVMSRRVGLRAVIAWWRLRGLPHVDGGAVDLCSQGPEEPGADAAAELTSDSSSTPLARISVLIPTLDRYSYLTAVLDQLAEQTLPPIEIIVIDQTAKPRRKRQMIVERHGGRSSRLIYLERDIAGQSSARNAGLERATGDYIMFLDDDVDIESDLLERHARNLQNLGADASCGTVIEVGAGALPRDFQRRRMSDVFPAGNSLLRRQALAESGLFDLAFDHGARADADLGTRLYLSGHLLVLDPGCSLLHYKAPSGGLRQHGARIVTFASSRQKLLARHLPGVTEIYLAMRYSSAEQTREMLLLRALGTLRSGGSRAQKFLKLLLGVLSLPSSLWRIYERQRRARAMLTRYPVIPRLESVDLNSQDPS